MRFLCDNRRCLPPTPRRQGFVLVMVLVLLTVAAIALSGMARHSLRLAAEAADAQSSFERKWQTATLQRALLSNVESLLNRPAQVYPDAPITWPLPASVEGQIDAGRFQYHYLLADEDAKVNLNQVLRQDRDQFLPLVMQLLQTTNAGGLIPISPPVLPRNARNRVLLQSWGQVFSSQSGGLSGLDARQLRDATRLLTCWGGGRLNVQRAPDESIHALCTLLLRAPTVAELLGQRSTEGLENLEDLIALMELKAEERFILQRLLTDQSGCFTLWLTASNGQREWTSLIVSRSAAGDPSNWLVFTW